MLGERRRPTTASSRQVAGRELRATPYRNAEDALRLVPGLTLVQHGSEGKGHQFFLRGFDAIHGADLELTLEGIPLNEWSNVHAQGYIDLGLIIPEAIDSVEVTKGPFTLDQGAFAMAGSADYRLGIAPAERGLYAAYTAGTTNRHRTVFSYSPRGGDGRELIAGELLHDDGFGENRAIDRGAALARVHLLESARYGTVSLFGAAYASRFELPGTLRESDVRAGRRDFYSAYDHAGAGLSARSLVALVHTFRNRSHDLRTILYTGYRRLELLENYTGFLIDPINGDRRRQQQNNLTFGAIFEDQLELTRQLALQLGVGVRGDVLEQTQRHVSLALTALEPERDLSGLQTLTHASVGVRWQPHRDLDATAGARFSVAQFDVRDRLSEDGRASGALGVLTPRVSSEWRVLPGWRLFAAYGRGFRPAEARAFTRFEPERTGIGEELYDGGRPSMTVADAVELGTRWLPDPLFGVRAAGFATYIARESVFDHVSGINLELNATRRVGAELELTSSPLPWLRLSADATYADARFTGSGNRIPFAPAFVAGARAMAMHGSGLHGGLRAFGLAPRPLPHGSRGAALAMVDVAAGYDWSALRLDLELENVLGSQIREGEYHFASAMDRRQPPSEIPVVQYVAGPPRNLRVRLSAVF